MEKIKVFLSDPQILFREGIHFILSGEDDFDVTDETTNNEEALTLIEANPPNIAILSMQSGKFNGAEATRRIKRSLPSVSVILTLDKSDEEQLFSVMISGASSFLTKDTDPEYLLDIIRVVAQGSQPMIDSLLIPGIASKVLTEFQDLNVLSEQLGDMLAILSSKEIEILQSIIADNGIEQITTKLATTEESIRRSLKSILQKLIANDQAQVLIEAAQRSLPSIIRGVKTGNHSNEYVTKAEFNEFKDSLMERLKSFIGELA